jgi:hypothetical protein
MKELLILKGGLGRSAIAGCPEYCIYDDDYDQASTLKFLAEYTLVTSKSPGDPQEDYYQGMTFATVYRRKSDDKLFGFSYWEPVSKHGEAYFDANSEEFDITDANYDTYVFTEIEPFIVQGYRPLKASEYGKNTR